MYLEESKLVSLRASFDPKLAQLFQSEEALLSGEKLSEKKQELILQQYSNLQKEIKTSVRRMNASGSVTETANLGEAKKFYLPLIVEAYGEGIGDQIAHFVPMDSKEGFIRLTTINAGTAKNGIAVGDALWSNGLAPAKRDDKYPFGMGGGSIHTTGAITAGTISVPLDVATTGAAVAGSVAVSLKDNNGAVIGTATQKADGTFDVTGAISAAVMGAGGATVELTATTTTDSDADAQYNYKLEQAMLEGNGNKITFGRVAIPLYAEESVIEAYNTFFAQYDLNKEDGKDLNEESLKAGAATIRYARDMRIINTMYNFAGHTLPNWSKTKPADFALQKDYNETFIDRIVDASGEITSFFEGAIGNIIIVGKEGANVLKKIGKPRFEGASRPEKGPYYMGELDGEYKVFYVPHSSWANKVLVGFKGDRWEDCGFVVGVYCGFISTQLLLHANFKGEQGYGEICAYKLVRPNFYAKFGITV